MLEQLISKLTNTKHEKVEFPDWMKEAIEDTIKPIDDRVEKLLGYSIDWLIDKPMSDVVELMQERGDDEVKIHELLSAARYRNSVMQTITELYKLRNIENCYNKNIAINLDTEEITLIEGNGPGGLGGFLDKINLRSTR